jgi:hypothetical protein
MLLRRFTDFILRSRLHAMGTAFVLSLVPLFGASIGILIAAFVTLRKGALEGTFVLCAAITPYLINYALSPASTQPQMIMIATETIIAINILTWVLALVLRKFGNWNLVIEVSILAGIVLICVIHLIFPELQTWWGTQLTTYFNKTTSMIEQLSPEGAATQEEMQAAIIANIKQYITGLVIASIIFNALLQLIIARWWQAILYNPGGLRKELHQIRLSYVSASVFIAVLGLAYMHNVFGLDMMPVMVTAFCAAGLSVIHNLFALKNAGWFWLVLVYLGVLFAFPMGMVAVAMIGLLDSLFNIRQRFAK